MGDKSNTNFRSKMLLYISHYVAVLIVLSIPFLTFSFWILKLLLTLLLEILLRIGRAIIVICSEVKNRPDQNDNISDCDSDDIPYVAAEEELLDEFQDCQRYVRSDSTPNTVQFPPLSSAFISPLVDYCDTPCLSVRPKKINRNPESEKISKNKHSKKISEKRISPTDNIKVPYKPEKQKIGRRFESIENPKEIDVQAIANKWICPHPVNDNMQTSYESEKQKNENHLGSQDNLEQLPPENLHKTGCPVKDMNTLLELTEQEDYKQQKSHKSWKKRLLHGIFHKGASSNKDDSNISSHSTKKQASKRPKSKLPWKKRFFLCMSSKFVD